MPENSGINILPQFNSTLPIDPTDAGNPLNQGYDGYPNVPPPIFTGGAPANARNYPIPGTPYNPPAAPASLPQGVTPSAGGWNIDENGNLVQGWSTTGQDVGRTVGNFLGRTVGGTFGLPGGGPLGGFLGRQAGSLLGHGIFGLIGSISHGLGRLFGKNDATATTAPGGPAPQSMPNYSTIFNAGRGAFSPTYQQLNNPGSFIGPTTGANTNPYGMNNLGFHNGLAKAGPEITSMPAFAAANMNYIMANKQR